MRVHFRATDNLHHFYHGGGFLQRGKGCLSHQQNSGGTKNVFEDRQHILYVNASYEGEDEIEKLMHDFLCSDPDEMYTELMAEKTRYLKKRSEGVELMCKAMEEMRDEVEKRTEFRTQLESIKNIMEGLKYTAQQAMDLLKIPVSDQPKYLAKI